MEQLEFELKNSRNIQVDGLGSIIYPKWSSTKGEISAGSQTYNMIPKGFWGTTVHLMQNERQVYEIKMSFWGKVTITPLQEAHHFYTLAGMKGFKSGYRLLDYKGNEVATITSKWKKWKSCYILSTPPGFLDTDHGKLMGLLLVRQFRGAQQAAVAAAT